MKVKIRRANINEGQEALALLKELRTSTYQEMGLKKVKVVAAPNALDFYKKIIKQPNVLCLLALGNEKIYGLCLAYLVPKILDAGYRLLIEEIIVKQEFRGQEVGSALLKTMEKEAKKRGIRVVKLTSGTKLRASKFYKKHGYIHFENAYRKKL